MLVEIWRLLTEWVRNHPEAIAAFVVGTLVAEAILIWLWWWFRSPRVDDTQLALRLRLEQLEREHQELRAQAADLRTENRGLRETEARLRQESAVLRESLEARSRELASIREELRQALSEIQRWQSACQRQQQNSSQLTDQLEQQRERYEQILEQYCSQLERIKQERDQLRQELDARISIEEFDGRIWQSRPLPKQPAFVPARKRKTRILAFVNLKGGVGKTTLTAFLGAALWELKKRALLLDLDFQGSLSSLCLGDQYPEIDDELFISQLFRQPAPSFAELQRRAVPSPIFESENSQGIYHVVAASDDLHQVESMLLSRWLSRHLEIDVRQILLQVLHEPQVEQFYDYVLLDCPPRLSTACINALCCCDYVVIPTKLDRLSANGVYHVLRTLQVLSQRAKSASGSDEDEVPPLCPHLEVLAVVPTFVRRRSDKPIGIQQRILEVLPTTCAEIWGKEVFVLTEGVPESSQFAGASMETFFAPRYANLSDYFRDIANQLLGKMAELERARRRTATIP